jgi:hypothetical protein
MCQLPIIDLIGAKNLLLYYEHLLSMMDAFLAVSFDSKQAICQEHK